MSTNPENQSFFKQPTAGIPLVMSFLALALILGYLAILGVVHQEDEGIAARIFQFLMILQIPIIVFFALAWLRKRFKEALVVLVVQIIAWTVPILAVLFFEG